MRSPSAAFALEVHIGDSPTAPPSPTCKLSKSTLRDLRILASSTIDLEVVAAYVDPTTVPSELFVLERG